MKLKLLLLLPIMLIMSQIANAQGPVVSQDELKQALTDAAKTRKENLDQVRTFFSSDASREAFKTAHIDSERVQKAVSSLDDNELTKLADQTRHIQNDFAAGALTNQQITYILIALATAVIVLIAVH
jgi:FKBP-type peptidyl-prolyl cis-trans isomerase (trigger factor)